MLAKCVPTVFVVVAFCNVFVSGVNETEPAQQQTDHEQTEEGSRSSPTPTIIRYHPHPPREVNEAPNGILHTARNIRIQNSPFGRQRSRSAHQINPQRILNQVHLASAFTDQQRGADAFVGGIAPPNAFVGQSGRDEIVGQETLYNRPLFRSRRRQQRQSLDPLLSTLINDGSLGLLDNSLLPTPAPRRNDRLLERLLLFAGLLQSQNNEFRFYDAPQILTRPIWPFPPRTEDNEDYDEAREINRLCRIGVVNGDLCSPPTRQLPQPSPFFPHDDIDIRRSMGLGSRRGRRPNLTPPENRRPMTPTFPGRPRGTPIDDVANFIFSDELGGLEGYETRNGRQPRPPSQTILLMVDGTEDVEGNETPMEHLPILPRRTPPFLEFSQAGEPREPPHARRPRIYSMRQQEQQEAAAV